MPEWKGCLRRACDAAGHLPDEDIIEELATHAVAAYEAARADGDDAEQASRRVDALIDGWRSDATTLQRRPKREAAVVAPAASTRAWTGIMHDVRYGLRLLRRQPGFALVTMLTMALGIGVTTSLFSVTYGVLLKPLPWFDADRLVRLSESRKGHEPRVRGTITNGTYLAWQRSRRRSKVLAAG